MNLADLKLLNASVDKYSFTSGSGLCGFERCLQISSCNYYLMVNFPVKVMFYLRHII